MYVGRQQSQQCSSLPAEQETPAAGHAQQGGLAAAAAASAQQLLLLPMTHQSSASPSADSVAAPTSLAVSLHPTGNNSVALKLTPVTANLPPVVSTPSLPSNQNAGDSAMMCTPSEGSAPHAAAASGIQASVQQGSKLSHRDALLQELDAPLLDTQGPPLLDMQGPPLGYTQVHAWKVISNLCATDRSLVMQIAQLSAIPIAAVSHRPSSCGECPVPHC